MTPLGIIFIDCWQSVAQGLWPLTSENFNFYRNMITCLEKYPVHSRVFHTGTFGDLPLAQELELWHQEKNSTDIMILNVFQQHYQQVNVRNWIVVGAHWQRCTHDKPLGFRNLARLQQQDPKLRIFSHPVCTAKFVLPDSENDNIDNPITSVCRDQDYLTDSLKWHPYQELFELTAQ